MAMSSQEPIPVEKLYSDPKYAEMIAATKTIGIIRSTTALISLVASLILIWMLKRSKDGFSSIYHRVLLGMCIADVIFSLSQAHFNTATPRETDYYVWNAIGNQYTCNARGYLHYLGAITTIFYNCSINLYSLAIVKYQLSATYIRRKIEPFLHGVPIAWAVVYVTIRVTKGNFNDGGGGNCLTYVYSPPHCQGYEDGEVREGFEIPCGRGRDGPVLFGRWAFFISWLTVPFFTLVSLWMIYKAVKKVEQATARYGVGALAANANPTKSVSDDSNGDYGDEFSLRSMAHKLRSITQVRTNRTNRQSTKSRAVLNRAFGFTVAFFLTWSFELVGASYAMVSQGSIQNWPVPIKYLANTFTPLQGFFNLCVFLQPKVSNIKSRGGDDLTWCQALSEGFWSSLKGGKATRRRIKT